MSDDIVERLRAAGHNALMDEAADEIERLRKVLRELDFYENDPLARNKIRVALGGLIP